MRNAYCAGLSSCGRLNNLGNVVQARFDRTGAQADLDVAI